jgi:long-chain fatty acid transport protein
MKKHYRYKRSLLALAGSFAMTASPCLFAGSPALTGLVAEADNAESAFSAPAGMSRLKGTRLTVQTMFVQSFADFEVDSNTTTLPGGNPDKGKDPMIIPSIYYVRQLNDRWHAGLSLTVPSGFGSNYGSKWSGRYETVDFSLVYVALTPAVSYRVNDKLSLGGAIGINYTSESSEVKILQPFQEGDGKITSDLDGVGFNVTLSVLYEFTPQTRAGISWTSDSDADLDGNVRLRNLDPVFDEVATKLGIKNINTEITNTLPQRLLAGVYHEFDSGRYFTVDGMWMKFSDFSVSDISLNGNNVNVDSPDIYDDIYALTIGAGFPASDPRLTYKIGAMYVSQAVDDDDRTFSIRLDEMWGVGAGVSYDLTSGNTVDLNANLINVGDSPVDKGTALNQRVAGKNDDPWALMFELTYHM